MTVLRIWYKLAYNCGIQIDAATRLTCRPIPTNDYRLVQRVLSLLLLCIFFFLNKQPRGNGWSVQSSSSRRIPGQKQIHNRCRVLLENRIIILWVIIILWMQTTGISWATYWCINGKGRFTYIYIFIYV